MISNNYGQAAYNNNPLTDVVCQLDFPRILKIDEKQPTDFQERIRGKFPLFRVNYGHRSQFFFEVGANGSASNSHALPPDPVSDYMFSSADEKWRVRLTSTSLLLSTSACDSREELTENLHEPLKALIDVYQPALFERISLNHSYTFWRAALGIEGCDWAELIQPFALGFMANAGMKDKIRTNTTIADIDMGDGATAHINTSKWFMNDFKSGVMLPTGEEQFSVKSDVFVLKKTAPEEVGDLFERLHGYSAKLIRSVITDKLYEAMKPFTPSTIQG